MLQQGLRFKGMMGDEELNNTWLTSALFPASDGNTDTNASLASFSGRLNPFESSESSHSFAESERSQSEAPTTAGSLPSGPLVAPLELEHQNIVENGVNSLNQSTAHPAARKGHKKSRGGCFNCKRRKIKVGIISSKVKAREFDSFLVPRNAANMRELYEEEPWVQISCSKDFESPTSINALFLKSDCIRQSARHTNHLHLHGHAAFPPLSDGCISAPTGGQ